MARIYKESRYVLQLLIGKSYVAQYDDVKISFYTKNPSNQVMVDNDITIKRNIAEVMVDSTLFDNLEDGLISYIVYGTKDGIPFIEERQSNYFLKTPLDFKPTTCILEDKSVTPSMGDRNDDGYIIIEKSEGYDGLSRVVIDPQTLYNEGVEAGRAECSGPAPAPPQDGWGMTGYFNNWGGTPDIPFEEDGEWDGRPYKVIRGFEAVQGEFKIRRNNAWTDSRTATFENIPQFAKLKKGDMNMQINDGVWDIYLFFGNDGVPNEMLVLNPGTDLSTIKYEYTLNLSADKESAIFLIGDSFDYSAKNYYGGTATIPMKYGCRYSINVFMEGYEDIFEEITCYNDEERSYTLTKIEGYGCNFINPIVFSKEAGNTINAENAQIPTFVYEGNQYYNVDSFNLADIEEFKIHILFKPNNSGDTEPINVFGCEDTDWDDTTFGARIHQGWIYFRMSGQDVSHSYTENTWYDVEMGYNTSKRWVILNGETLLDEEYASFNKPSQTLMIGAINSGGNAFRPFYGHIAAIYIKSNANQIYLLPKEDGTMGVYWNNLTNSRNSISGENNARFENDYISGDGMKSITWLGNLEDKWVTPSMSERDGNGYIVVSPSEGYNGLKRTVINPQTLYNEGVNEQKSKLESISITENGIYSKEDGYNHIEVNVMPKINLQETGLKLGYSSFTEVPEWADFEGITNMAYMFYECNSLETIPLIDTSNVTGMSFMFGHCHKLQTIPLIDTSNVIYMNNMFSFCIELQTIPLIDTSNVTRMDNMFSNCSLLQTIPQINTSNVTDMSHMFDNCFNLQTIPSIDTSNVTEMNYMFTYCQKLQTLPKFNCQKVTDMTRYFTKTSGGMSSLTDVGGWENLKCNWDDVYGLATCPNLTYQSCINVLNGLYDFVGNGSTETRTLRVHPNFLTTVGDEISIGTNKGWQITA